MEVKLLIIESDNLFRMNLSQRLRAEGYETFEAGRHTDTKKILKRRNMDVVLLGLNGLKRAGLALLKMIKTIRPSTEVIIINSSEQLSLSIEAMKLGAFDDFLVPFELDALIQRIREAYEQKKQREKAKRPLLRRYQDMMIAATFAEAGEAEMASEFLREGKKGSAKNRRKDKA